MSNHPPFGNCGFDICDLPGQCQYEGKCHHPAKNAKDEITLSITEYEQLKDGKQCAWQAYDDDNAPGTYETSCGELWTFMEGGIKENNVHYCHSCGGKVIEAIDQAVKDKPNE